MYSNNLCNLPFSLTTVVEKVHQYTGTELSKKDGLYVVAAMAEEFKIKAREQIFNLQINAEKVKNELNNNSYYLSFDESAAIKAKSYVEAHNRCVDYLVGPLKDMLRPVWSVYWGESCTGISIICTWLLKADQDEGKKVFDKLNLVHNYDI